MEVSVIIPCHGGVQDTLACLHTLQTQAPSPLYDRLQILVVDNLSPDDTAERVSRMPGVELLRQPRNLGFAGGVNAGLRAARGEIQIILNNDTLAAPNLLHRLVSPLLQDRGIGISAPVSNHVKGFALIETGDLGSHAEGRAQLEATLAAHEKGRLQDVETLSGLCLALRRGVLARLGGFDERFGRGNYEDDDFCLRARLCGYRLVIVRDAFLHHLGSRTFSALGMDYTETLTATRQLFLDKWRHDPVGQVALAASEAPTPTDPKAVRHAMRRHPNWADGDLILAHWHHHHRRAAPAKDHLRRFLTRCPQHPGAWILLGYQLLRLRGEAAGMQCFGFAMAHCHFSATATLDMLQLQGAWLLEVERPLEAAARFSAALELAPTNSHFHNLLGKAWLDAGQFDQAVQSFQQSYDCGETQAIVGLGASQWQAGNWEQALVTLARATAELPGDASAQRNFDAALAELAAQGVATEGLRQQAVALATCPASAS